MYNTNKKSTHLQGAFQNLSLETYDLQTTFLELE